MIFSGEVLSLGHTCGLEGNQVLCIASCLDRQLHDAEYIFECHGVQIGAVGDGRVTNCELIGVLRRVVERWFEYGRCLSGVGEYEFPVFVFYRVEYFGAIGAIA